MTGSNAWSFLRKVLVVDGVISGACGLTLVLGAGPLERWLGIPAALLRPVGLTLFPFTALLLSLARRAALSRATVGGVIAANGIWVAGSVLLLVSGWIDPTGLGYAFVVGQAAVVAVFAEMEYVGLKKSGAVEA